MEATKLRMPTFFLAHGGGPMPLMGDPSHRALVEHLSHLHEGLPQPPRALVVISAHWEEGKPMVTSGERPGLYYDYARPSIQKEAYEVKYDAPGDPELAHRIVSLLRDAGIDAGEDAARGWDHGVFVPLKLAFPSAQLPVVELCVLSSLDPEAHIAVGEALESLRGEGVLILGSGMTYHNMKATFASLRNTATEDEAKSAADKSAEFEAALTGVLTDAERTPEQRRDALVRWKDLPEARFNHPREEHLLPLHVVAGAAGCGTATADFRGELFGAKLAAFRFD